MRHVFQLLAFRIRESPLSVWVIGSPYCIQYTSLLRAYSSINMIYRCESCTATFTTQRRLRRHQRTHRRFGCNRCSARFATLEQLNRHHSSHQRSVSTQTNTTANLGCRLLTPTKDRPAAYHESAASREARLRREDPLQLAEDMLLASSSSDEETATARDW